MSECSEYNCLFSFLVSTSFLRILFSSLTLHLSSFHVLLAGWLFGCWLLAVGCWLSGAGCWLGLLLLAGGVWVLIVAVSGLLAGCWWLAGGCWCLGTDGWSGVSGISSGGDSPARGEHTRGVASCPLGLLSEVSLRVFSACAAFASPGPALCRCTCESDGRGSVPVPAFAAAATAIRACFRRSTLPFPRFLGGVFLLRIFSCLLSAHPAFESRAGKLAAPRCGRRILMRSASV